MTPSLEQTLQFVTGAHKGQMYNDEPYVFHLVRVASMVEGLENKTIALLHDVLEDTAITQSDLFLRGYSLSIIKSVVDLTHKKNTPYIEYIANLGEVEQLIKSADIIDHLQHLHLIKDHGRRIRLEKKYIAAGLYLLEHSTKGSELLSYVIKQKVH